MSQNNGIERPVYIESFGQQRRLWYTATNGDAVHRFPVRSEEVWNGYSLIPNTPDPGLINDGDTVGEVTLRKNKALELIPSTTHKFRYAIVPPDELRQIITATFGNIAPVAGSAAPTLQGLPATGYTPVITDSVDSVHEMQQSVWIADGLNHYIEFPYGVPSNIIPPLSLTYFEYNGATGGIPVWHYVADATSPNLTLCPNPDYPGPLAAGVSHFVTPLAAQSTEGNNTRLMLDVAKGAIRGGTVTANQWDDASRGIASAAFGLNNEASGDYSVVAGGEDGVASGIHSAIGGGNGNTASGLASSITGGELNTASGDHSTVSGGVNNAASGDTSWAGGNGSTASDARSFVWSDSVARASTAADEVTYGAAGGFRILDGCLKLLRPNGTGGGVLIDQSAADPCPPAAGQGTFWVRDDAPTVPVFTDSAGTDHRLLVTLNDGGVAAGHQSLVEDGVGPDLATKGAVAGPNVVLSSTATDVTISAFVGGIPPTTTGPWIFYDQKAAGVPGGAYPIAGAWQTRVLNLQHVSAGADIQLAVAPAGANQLLIQPGVYHIYTTSPGVDLEGFRIRLYDPAGMVVLALGASSLGRSSANLNQSMSITAFINAVFAVGAQTVAEIQIRGNNTGPVAAGSTAALGAPAGTGADPEIYTMVCMYKIG